MSDLREYISKVKKIKELKTIKTKVSTKYEIAGITAKVDNSHAVLFENIKESDFRLVSNLVGTRKRFALAVGGTDKNIHQKVISAIKNAKAPKIIPNGKFMENKSKNVLSMPIVTHFEKESVGL
jgi:UbiD family decarboxylase